MKSNTSLIIPTYKRLASLVVLLKNLSKGEKDFKEIIIVEQVENNKKDVEVLAKKLGLPVRYIFLPEASTAHAMNVGVEAAMSEFVLFLDDDVEPKADLIKNHLNIFSDEHVAATVGRAITAHQKIEPEYNRTGRINWLGQFSDGFSSLIKQEVDTVIGCNTCWRKSVYLELGGIDEQFTGNAIRLESDLSLRAKSAGYKIIYEPLAEVFHRREELGGARKTENRMKWYFDFFSNESYFFLKHFSVYLFPLFLLTKWEWAFRCMFGFGREVSMRSFKAPILGICNGVRKYTRYGNRR